MPDITLPALLIAVWTIGTVLLTVWALHILATAPVLGDCQNCGEATDNGPLCRPCAVVAEGVAA